jgi:putative endonuclease
MWNVYILSCSDESLYAGIAKNLKSRIEEHNSGKFGAKYTRGRRPVSLVYFRRIKNRSSALREEIRIKKLTRGEKLEIIRKWKIRGK